MARREEKKLRRQNANAAQKSLTGVTTPDSSKSVGKASAAPEPIDGKPFRWSATFVDHDHSTGWDWDLAPREAAELLRTLESMSALTWREVKDLKFNSKRKTRALNHSQPTESICSEAQDRLIELELDLDEVFRLRHGNLTRIWGYLQGPVFYLLWYDRDHAVCPGAN